MEPVLERVVRTRGYETDVNRTVPLVVLMSYLEHLRWETMLHPPLGLVDALACGHFFVVRGQVVELCTSVGQGHDLLLRAVLERTGRSSAFVRHEVVRAGDGVLVAQARVHGVWMGPDRKPARIPRAMRAYTEQQLPSLEQLVRPEPGPWNAGVAPVRPADSFVHQPDVPHPIVGLDAAHAPDDLVARAAETGFVHTRTVEASDIDIFGHVNAVRYLGFVHDARDRAARAGTPALSTHRAALRGRMIRADITYYREALCADRVDVHLAALTEGSTDDRLALGTVLCRSERPDEPLCKARIDLMRAPVPIRHRGEPVPDDAPAGA